jgi:hypothetical protein
MLLARSRKMRSMLKPSRPGQHNIQNDGIEMLILNDLKSLVSAMNNINHKPKLFKPRCTNVAIFFSSSTTKILIQVLSCKIGHRCFDSLFDFISALVNILLRLLNMVIQDGKSPATFMNISSPKVTVDWSF